MCSLYGIPGTGKTRYRLGIGPVHLGCPLYEIACEDEDGNPIDSTQRLRAYFVPHRHFPESPTLMLFDKVEGCV